MMLGAEPDIPIWATLDDSVAQIRLAAEAVRATFAVAEAAQDFVFGAVEIDRVVQFEVAVMQITVGHCVVRFDRDHSLAREFGRALAPHLP